MFRSFCLSLALPLLGCAALLTPVWVELGPSGQVLARVIIDSPGSCPSISIDGAAAVAMNQRTPVPTGLPPACEFAIPSGTKQASVGSQSLALPVDQPSPIVVLGDTGCRMKDPKFQSCNDPNAWPFPKVANTAAAGHPQLVIHVGDYLYRESSCPVGSPGCKGSPSGFTWDSWNADFFTPAAPLLAAAPWAFSRGNHEDCNRAWEGWFYYLDPRPMSANACAPASGAYLAGVGKFQLLMFDSSSASETRMNQLKSYTADLQPFASTNAWLVAHHPFWGLRGGGSGAVPLTKVLAGAYSAANLSGIGLIISGHTHVFEILGFANRPPQLIVGDAGTALDGTPRPPLKGADVFGNSIATGDAEKQFGFVVLEKGSQAGEWKMTLRSPSGKSLKTCSVNGNDVQCAP